MHGPTCVVWANLTPFAPQNHEQALYTSEQCVYLAQTNEIKAATPAYPSKIYYKTAPPSQRNNLLGTSPGVYARDAAYPLDGSAAFNTVVNAALTEYTGCIPITESTSIVAYAVGDGFAPSLMTVATYWVQLDQPTIGTTNDGDREITSATETQEALTFTSGHGMGPPGAVKRPYRFP
jgi:hypothetical protein